jgi:hypothetical protein
MHRHLATGLIVMSCLLAGAQQTCGGDDENQTNDRRDVLPDATVGTSDATVDTYPDAPTADAKPDSVEALPSHCYGSNTSPSPRCPWLNVYGGTGLDRANAMTVDSDGTIYTGGVTADGFHGYETKQQSDDAFIVSAPPSGDDFNTSIFGSQEGEFIKGMTAADGGSIYAVGGSNLTDAATDNDPDTFSHNEIYIATYDRGTGTTSRTRFGSPEDDSALAVTDHASGGIIVGGYLGGDFRDHSNNGGNDAFVAKFYGNSLEWFHVFGGEKGDSVSDLATDDSGHIYAVGGGGKAFGKTTSHLGDGFIIKFNQSGQEQWTRFFDGPDPAPLQSVATDSNGNAYVITDMDEGFAGQTYTGGRSDAVAAKYAPNGERQWVRLFGVSSDSGDRAADVSTDGDGHVYFLATTETFGATKNGLAAKFSVDGTLMDRLEFGGDAEDTAWRIQAHDNRVYVSGWTNGTLAGQTHDSPSNAFLMRINW